MKKIIMMMAAIAAFAFTSCEKNEPKDPAQANDIKINVTVSNLDGSADTRAAKTSWVAGDKINLWFSSWNPGAEDHTPQLVLTYDGSNWTAGALAAGTTLSDRQNVLAVYEGYNDLTKYTYDWYYDWEWFRPAGGYGHFSCDSYASPMVVSGSTQYRFSSSTLTLNLNTWTYETQFKVLVKNMPAGTASNFELKTENDNTSNKAGAKGAWIVEPGGYYLGNGSSNYKGVARGVQESDGIAFYYTGLAAENADIVFTLWDGTTEKTYTANDKTVSCANNKCIGVALDYSNFH